MKKIFSIFLVMSLAALSGKLYAQDVLSLDGDWKYIVDPQCIGLYSSQLKRVSHRHSFFSDRSWYDDRTKRVEYSFDRAPEISVPGDWNTQKPELMYYEGCVWYRRQFDYKKESDTRAFLRFGAVNYSAEVSLNGKILGRHEGGFTPFEFEVTEQLKDGENTLIVLVDNTRRREAVPTITTDWWNYGGITRSVTLVHAPMTYVKDYSVQYSNADGTIYGWVEIDGDLKDQMANVNIPELNLKINVRPDKKGRASFSVKADPQLWSPQTPKLYDVVVGCKGHCVNDRIGFRYIQTKGNKLYLNGKEIFCRGVCMHEEALWKNCRITEHRQNVELLSLAKELGCNFVRLAHYPYNEDMVRTAEEMGLMVWEEIPLYWNVTWDNPATYASAEQQLTEIIARDRNRANIIVWSVANETPVNEERTAFISKLIDKAKELDGTRLVSAAMLVHKCKDGTRMITDPLAKKTDLLSFNTYISWYGSDKPESLDTLKWDLPQDKPIFISEFGCGAVAGYHDHPDVRFSEEYMERYYRHTLKMLEGIPGLCGTTPWILADFRSPRRLLTDVQDNFNRKGLVSEKGYKKSGFFVMKDWYEKIRRRYESPRVFTAFPDGYLDQADSIPPFWVTTVDEVNEFIRTRVHKGQKELLGYSAGGRPIWGVTYGTARKNDGTTTYSGSLSVKKLSAYRGTDSDKKVFMAFGAVHGFEIEPIVGIINLISVFETGKDLNGNEWPQIVSMLDSLDRIVLVPLVNQDGRVRVPVRMEKFRGSEPGANHVHEWLTTGGYADGRLLGWPDCKEYIPLQFTEDIFPGGYPNDNGVNIMHDDFLGSNVQPETRVLLDLAGREKPDLILNMHCGVTRKNPYLKIFNPTKHDSDPMMHAIADSLRMSVYSAMIPKGYNRVKDLKELSTIKRSYSARVNLNTMLINHTGALCATIESPHHGWTGVDPDGTVVNNSPERILEMHMILFLESMRYLSRSGGMEQWEAEYKKATKK
jgi:beta-glucuronidase